MRARLLLPAQLLEALAQGVVGVMGGWIDLEQRLERLSRVGMLAAVVVRPPKRFEDGALSRLDARSAGKHGCRLCVVPRPHQLVASLQEAVRRFPGIRA